MAPNVRTISIVLQDVGKFEGKGEQQYRESPFPRRTLEYIYQWDYTKREQWLLAACLNSDPFSERFSGQYGAAAYSAEFSLDLHLSKCKLSPPPFILVYWQYKILRYAS